MTKRIILFICFLPAYSLSDSSCYIFFNKSNPELEINHSQGVYSKESLAERKQLGEKSLGIALAEKKVEALEKAHRVGLFKEGEDGTPAQIWNYTEAQLREKARILKKADFLKEERRKLMQDGVVGWWNFWRKPPPPSTNILTELSQKSTQVQSSINVYSQEGMVDYGESERIDYLYGNIYDTLEIKDLEKGSSSSVYWSRYVPRRVRRDEDRSLQYEGQFIIGFGKIFRAPEEQSIKGRFSYWYHRIHWDSGAREMPQLDQKTIRQIFTEIYGGEPEKIATEFQRQYAKERSSRGRIDLAVRYIFSPFLSSDRKEQIKQIVLRILQERDSKMTSATTEK